MDKETLEKARLANRREGHARYLDPGRMITPDDPSSDLFISEADRFVRDVAGEERLRRDEESARHAAEILRRREENARRDEERWERMEEEKRAEEERVARLRQDGKKAKKNQNSMPFDFLTNEYADSNEGHRLARLDEAVYFRAALRAQRLQAMARGQDFDLITGEHKPLISLPPAPPGGTPSETAPPSRGRASDAGRGEDGGGAGEEGGADEDEYSSPASSRRGTPQGSHASVPPLPLGASRPARGSDRSGGRSGAHSRPSQRPSRPPRSVPYG